jgi:outer membrane protein OmpA-like peptidoglycan-associated protein
MTHLEQQSKRKDHRLPGEDVPAGMALAFTLVGTLAAMVAAWSVIGPAPWAGQRTVTEASQHSPPNPDAKASAMGPSPVPSPTSQAEKEPPIIASQPLADAHDTPAITAECPPNANLTFKPGGAGLSRAEIGKLEPLRQWLSSHPQARLLVEGYTDPVGTEQSNVILSYRRAKVAAAALHQAGVPAQQMTIRAAGEHQPIPGLPDDAADYRQANLQIAGSENCQYSSTGRGR